MEKSMFLRSEAQRRCPKSVAPLRKPNQSLFPSVTHTTTLLHTKWYGPGTPLGSQQTSITSSNLPIYFQPWPEFLLWRKVQRGTRPGAHGSVSLLSEFTAAHTPSGSCSLTGLPHTEPLLSSPYGFSFCPHFIYFTCSAANAFKLDICIQELKSSFIKRQ